MKSLVKRLVILTAAVALPATLLTGPIASPAQAALAPSDTYIQATPAEAAEAPTDNYGQRVKGLKRLQASGASPNQFSLSVAPQVAWDAGLEGLIPPAASMYRLWDMGVAWKDVNPSRGVFDWTVLDRRVDLYLRGVKPLLVLGLTPQWAAVDPAAGDERWGFGTASPPSNIADWNNYVSAVVNRYGSRIGGYELWNEANLPTFWQGSIEKLYEMAASASSIIKAANPAAIVLAPSTTTRLRTSSRKFTTGFASQIPDGTKGPFDAWTIHSYPTGSAGVNLEDGTKNPRAAADKRVDDILNWQNALVDAVGSDSPALDMDIYDTEVNYGLKGPGTEPGQNWSAGEATQLMNMTYQDSQKLGINATFWYQYTAVPYDLLGVQWNPFNYGLSDMWYAMIRGGIPAIAGPSFLTPGGDLAIPNFKNCFIRLGSDCSGQKLQGIDLSGMPPLNINFTDAFLGNANMRKANLTGSNFNNAYLGNADMRETVISKINTEKGAETDFSARNFYKADFRNAQLTDIVITNGKMYGTDWTGAIFKNCEFSSSTINKAKFNKTEWLGDKIIFTNNNLSKTKFNDTNFKVDKITITKNNLSKTEFNDINFKGDIINFTKNNLSKTKFNDTNFKGDKITITNIDDLSKTKLNDIKVNGDKINFTNIDGFKTKLNDIKVNGDKITITNIDD